MKDLQKQWGLIIFLAIALSLCLTLTLKTYAGITNILNNDNSDKSPKKDNKVSSIESNSIKKLPARKADGLIEGITHKKVKRWLHGKPAIVNILVVNPKVSKVTIRPSYGSYFLNTVMKVRDIVMNEEAIAGINASYFKPDIGVPLGTSIINNEIITGPIYRRVTFGITKDKDFMMDRIDIRGEINIGDDVNLSLFNLNQPVFSKIGFTVFTDKWGLKTPKTSSYYSHIVVEGNRVQYVKNSSVQIPKGGYVIVGLNKHITGKIHEGDRVNYTIRIIPDSWKDVEYAVGGGPYLVRNGQIFIDKQNFSRSFLWTKAPRTAVGYTKGGSLVLVTIDGRHKGFSEGATLTELAQIMKELGCYNAMNLDGGTSTQMVVQGRLVNYPLIKGGGKVTNALLIIAPALDVNLSMLSEF